MTDTALTPTYRRRQARRRGVTVLPSAEGPSLRSHPRWTEAGERVAARVLDRLIAAARRDRDPGNS